MIFKTTISNPAPFQLRREKSRRDGILLTVGFNLRKQEAYIRSKSRRDGIVYRSYAVPAGLWSDCATSLNRRLNGTALDEVKPTVNNMPSLQDFLSITQHFVFLH